MSHIEFWKDGVKQVVRDELGDALAIVRELAESDPIATYYEEAWCHFCRVNNQLGKLAPHLPTCLWLRARKMAGL